MLTLRVVQQRTCQLQVLTLSSSVASSTKVANHCQFRPQVRLRQQLRLVSPETFVEIISLLFLVQESMQYDFKRLISTLCSGDKHDSQ